MDLPAVIPLFPLPNVVHFPRVPLPLHVFEERYRAMVRDALDGDRLIGMVLLQAGWEAAYHEAPPVFEVGTAGEIVRADPLDDGRWNIVLRGVREFAIRTETMAAGGYRTAQVEWRTGRSRPVPPEAPARIWSLVREYLALLERPMVLAAEPDDDLDAELLVNVLAQQIDLPVVDRQALLEAPDVAERATRLATALAFHVERLRSGAGGPPTVQ